MTVIMKKYLVVIACLFACLFAFCAYSPAQAQFVTNTKTTVLAEYEYYMFISGLDTKNKVIAFENKIRLKKGVTHFLSWRFPVIYFHLKSTTPISESEFMEWVKDKNIKVNTYAEGIYGKEIAIVAAKKSGLSLRQNEK